MSSISPLELLQQKLSFFKSSSEPIGWQEPILSHHTSLVLILSLATVSIVYVTVLIFLIIKRREMLPIKIKSPKLMLLSITANLFIILAVGVIQLSEEQCVNLAKNDTDLPTICNWHILEVFGIIFGYVIIGCAEPLAIISYVLRAFRLRRIYDA